MIAINKTEKEAIAKQLPYVHIVRTMRQKSKRHHYYCEENAQVMKLLSQIRSCTEGQEVSANYGNRTKE